uniref:Uncharacterized protein n=1 Tax=Ditylenchus dipsaci TaxID=166011 RepID=A0A915CUG2_9BILA
MLLLQPPLKQAIVSVRFITIYLSKKVVHPLVCLVWLTISTESAILKSKACSGCLAWQHESRQDFGHRQQFCSSI